MTDKIICTGKYNALKFISTQIIRFMERFSSPAILQHVRFLHISVGLISRGSLKVPQFQPNTMKSIYPYIRPSMFICFIKIC